MFNKQNSSKLFAFTLLIMLLHFQQTAWSAGISQQPDPTQYSGGELTLGWSVTLCGGCGWIADKLDIELYKDGSYFSTIAHSVDFRNEDGSPWNTYTWNIPLTISGSTFFIRIVDVENKSRFADTNNFEIIASSASAADVVIVIDTTGSTGALLPAWKKSMKKAVDDIKSTTPGARFALVSHLDFPFSPYGRDGEYAYRLEAPLNTDTTAFFNALNKLTSGHGGDEKESQLEAVYQAHTGAGRDLNGNGSYTDKGDITPKPLGFDHTTPAVTIHLTSPQIYHNDDPFEPHYPYNDVVNNPANFDQALAAIHANNGTHWIIQSDPLKTDKASKQNPIFDYQTGKPLQLVQSKAKSTGARLAEATGGKILSVGTDLSGLDEAITEIVKRIDICPLGQVPVDLPFGTVCIARP